MGKIFFRFFLLSLIILISIIIYLSIFGISTKKFNEVIKEKANVAHKDVQLDFKSTKIYLYIKELKLLIKLKDPKVVVKKKDINLSELDLFLSLKSFYTSDFLLEKAKVSFEKNNIKDLTKVTRIFLPRIINKKLNKIFTKGNLQGQFIIPFRSDGTISDDYEFYGKVLDADINVKEGYALKDFTAEIGFKDNSYPDGLRIAIKKAFFLNLDFSESHIDVNFLQDKKIVNSTIQSKGEINSKQIEKILSLLKYKKNYFKFTNFSSNLKTDVNFEIKKNFKIKNLSYRTNGDINELKIDLDKENKANEFFPDLKPEIVLKETKVSYSKEINGNQKLDLEGKLKFEDEFESIKVTQSYNKKAKKYNIKGNSTLDDLLINIERLNYIKEKKFSGNIYFDVDFILDNYFLIKSLIFSSDKNEINLNNVNLNKQMEIINLEKVKIKTYFNNFINNDFIIQKKNKIVITGKVFDAQSLLKSLYKKSDRKTFSKNFKSDIKIDLKKAITGTKDELSNFSMIGHINKGRYEKMILKGNYSRDEILEMSIYEVNGKKTLQLISDRAKPFIKNFNFIKGFEGGKLEYQSSVENKIVYSNLIITDFKVSKVPALAKLLTLASLQGIADTLSGEGIRFDSFEMKSNSKDNIMNIEDALAIGPAVSILLNGYVDKKKLVSLRGTLVPATKLNSIIASIPVVGDILVGKKTGEGVVGVSFKMKGPPKKIKTTVNPIKTLTPRFIVRAVEKMKKNKKNKTK